MENSDSSCSVSAVSKVYSACMLCCNWTVELASAALVLLLHTICSGRKHKSLLQNKVFVGRLYTVSTGMPAESEKYTVLTLTSSRAPRGLVGATSTAPTAVNSLGSYYCDSTV
jgi:hypothetical protein